MKFEVYCDEAFPDLMTSKNPKARYFLIGSLWLPADLREEIKTRIKSLRDQHSTWGEIKWKKVTRPKIDFYVGLIDLFMEYGDNIQFRCLAADRMLLNNGLYCNDHEQGFYNLYYQALHQGILDSDTYSIFCDTRKDRDKRQLRTLESKLAQSNSLANIGSIQRLPSRQVVLIQLTDLLLGAANSRMNNSLTVGTAKEQLVSTLENRLDRKLAPTSGNETKFSICKLKSEESGSV